MGPYLRKYQKWVQERPNLQVGDVCVLLDPTLRNNYPLCLIEEVIKGQDDLIRQVKVKLKDSSNKTTTTSLWRGIQSVYPVLKADDAQKEAPDGDFENEEEDRPVAAERDRRSLKTKNLVLIIT